LPLMIGSTFQMIAGAAVLVILGVSHTVAYTKGREASEARYDQLEREVAARAIEYQAGVKESQDKVAGLSLELAAAQAVIAQDTETSNVQIQVVASPSRECLSPATQRVLNARNGRPDQRASTGQGGKGTARTDAAPASVEVGVSELAMANWVNAAFNQYSTCRVKHATLAGVIRSLPNVVIE
jgi:hypothetical protein